MDFYLCNTTILLLPENGVYFTLTNNQEQNFVNSNYPYFTSWSDKQAFWGCTKKQNKLAYF